MKNLHQALWVVVGMVFFAQVTLWAQSHDKKERRSRHKALRKEIKAYRQKNVWPVMRAQRQKLEAVMSAADRQKVADLRSQMHMARTRMRTFRKELHESHPAGKRPELTEEQRKVVKTHHKTMRKSRYAAWELADKYETTIDALLSEIKPQKKKWRQEIKAIKIKHLGERKKEAHDEMGKKRHRRGRHHRMKRLHHPISFLLLDLSNPQADTPNNNTSVVFPNPSGSASKVSFDLIKSEKVSIQLMDSQGKLIKEVFNAVKPAGSHSQTIDMSGLKNGIYYVIIKSSQGTESKRVIKR